MSKDIKRDLKAGNASEMIPNEYITKWVSLFNKIIG